MIDHALLLQNYLLPGGEIDTPKLKQLAIDHPYFPIPGFYLLKDAVQHNKKIEPEALTATMHFTNKRWLDFQLHEQIQVRSVEAPIIEVPATEPQELLVPIEPYHTIDYFASQGIKLSRDGAMGDKLGKQMKSFTDWLKTMKKVSGERLPEGNDNTDKNIQSIAEASNTNAEVVTEAMADVLEKQGKTEKAIETYTKLSLLNPSKSAYFAAKIDSLKQS